MRSARQSWFVAWVLAFLLAGCDRGSPAALESRGREPAPPASMTPKRADMDGRRDGVRGGVAPSAKPTLVAASKGLSRRNTSGRIVAIGDVHGDFNATRQVLRLAGAIDDKEHWSGGELVVVQTGDQLDRGDQELEILRLLERLTREAAQAGGALVVLNGNHEAMTVAADFRYVTPGGFQQFKVFDHGEAVPAAITARFGELARGRFLAFRPGAELALLLSERPLVALVNDNLFAHGGVLEKHVAYGLERINREVRAWMRGEGELAQAAFEQDAPVWSRHYSVPQPTPAACAELGRVLDRVGARRLVVGHTVHEEGITSACDARVWRIDVGLAAYYGGESLQALEIVGERVRVLKATKQSDALKKSDAPGQVRHAPPGVSASGQARP